MRRNCVSNVFQEELKSLLHPVWNQPYHSQGRIGHVRTHLACSGTAEHCNGIPEYRNSKALELVASQDSFRIVFRIVKTKVFSRQSLHTHQERYLGRRLMCLQPILINNVTTYAKNPG